MNQTYDVKYILQKIRSRAVTPTEPPELRYRLYLVVTVVLHRVKLIVASVPYCTGSRTQYVKWTPFAILYEVYTIGYPPCRPLLHATPWLT